MITDDDILLLEEAMILAQQGEGNVNPNPLVGALIVKDDEIIAHGYHRKYGSLHAEREAFQYADSNNIDCTGATMYVTLEPCCHHGHQPPCTEAIIEHKISRVVVGLLDPNPLVGGNGIKQLQEAGIEVASLQVSAVSDAGVKECRMNTEEFEAPAVGRAAEMLVKRLRQQNRVFLKFITTGMPWVTAKWAMTLDGKIAAYTGDSKWITNEQSRERVHMIRRNNMAILCGIGTVLADDPLLNVRLSEEALKKLDIEEFEVRNPVRIVADRRARIPMESQLVSTAHEYPTVVAYADGADEEKLQMLRDAGVVLWNCNSQQELLQRAGAEKLDSVLLESGGTLSESLLREGLIDEVLAFVAPKIIGGKQSKTPVEGEGFALMSEAIELTDTVVETIGSDVLISGMIEKCSQE